MNPKPQTRTILCMETATKACSVALWDTDRYLAQRDLCEDEFVHAEKLHVLIDEVMQQAGVKYSNLDAIAVGAGPGSYTGLRIGVSTAKGLAYSQGIPLLSIPTLQVMAQMARLHIPEEESDFILRPLLDARRMEVYSTAYNSSLQEQDPCRPFILDEEERPFDAELDAGHVYFFGDGMDKCREVLSYHSHARFIPDIYPSASRMGSLAQQKLDADEVENTAYFEPFYLKEYVAKLGKKML